MAEKIGRDMRYDLIYYLISKDVAFFDENQTGNLMSRISGDTEIVCNGLSTNVSMALRSILFIIGSLVLMLMISWLMTLISFAAILTILLVFMYYRKQIT